MSKLIFLLGAPCHGKTTYRNKHFSNQFVISKDDIRDRIIDENNIQYKDLFYPDGENTFFDELKDDVILQYENSLKEAKLKLFMGETVILDLANLMTAKERNDICELIIPDNVSVEKSAFIFEADNDLVEKLNDIRAKETGKEIPFKIITAIKEKFEYPGDDEAFSSIKKLNILKQKKQHQNKL